MVNRFQTTKCGTIDCPCFLIPYNTHTSPLSLPSPMEDFVIRPTSPGNWELQLRFTCFYFVYLSEGPYPTPRRPQCHLYGKEWRFLEIHISRLLQSKSNSQWLQTVLWTLSHKFFNMFRNCLFRDSHYTNQLLNYYSARKKKTICKRKDI